MWCHQRQQQTDKSIIIVAVILNPLFYNCFFHEEGKAISRRVWPVLHYICHDACSPGTFPLTFAYLFIHFKIGQMRQCPSTTGTLNRFTATLHCATVAHNTQTFQHTLTTQSDKQLLNYHIGTARAPPPSTNLI